jgi:GT2 family glycosyltransferase
VATEHPFGVDLVVVNYRTPADLDRYLRALEQNPPSTPATLAIINVSPRPEDREVAHRERNLGLESVWGVNHDDNVGYARACNQAGSQGTYRYLLLSNADVVFPAEAIDRCVKALEENPDWGVLGPRQVDESGRLTHGGIFGSMGAPKHRAWRAHNHDTYADIRPDAVTVSGAAYFIRRSVWDELTVCPRYRQVAPDALGAFLPTPHYFEETFCSYHAQAHGHKVVYYGPVCILHSWHRASPVGGWAEAQFPNSREIFRRACDAHGLEHD